MNFPIFNTKELGNNTKFDLSDPASRKEYFELKLGSKIEDIKKYLETNSFVAFLLAKKSAGKGTYSKMFAEIVGPDKIAHLSVGDIVRDVHKAIEDPKELEALREYMNNNYRGFISPDEAIDALLGRSQDKLIPTEFILTLVKREIEKVGRKALFIDGFPRSLDQISSSLYFRDLINFRDDPDLFVLIDVPESVIDERMKYRAVCPECHTSKNTKLNPTKFIQHNKGKFSLICDNASCGGFGKTGLVRKEGDELGIDPIRKRLEMDNELIKMATKLQGVPKIMVRNSIPADVSQKYAEDYEITPEFCYSVAEDGKVEVQEKPWTIKDDDGIESNSLMAAPVVVSLFSQMHKILIG